MSTKSIGNDKTSKASKLDNASRNAPTPVKQKAPKGFQLSQNSRFTAKVYWTLRALLRPLCWARTRMAWPYPISGHKFIELPTYKEGTIVHEPLKCLVCGLVEDGWYDELNPPLEYL